MKLDINKPIIYDCSSHRRFRKGERHITRVCSMSVLLLVYEGVLRFGEGETQIEVKSGEYYIQRAGIAQNGLIESDCPRYYYVHFSGEYTENDGLSLRGKWQPEAMMPLIEGMEGNADSGSSYLQKSRYFYSVLDELNKQNERERDPIAKAVMNCLITDYRKDISIKELAKKLYISENYLINIFKREYGVTPYRYVTLLRLEKAVELLAETSRTEEEIALSVGFSDFSVFYKAFRKKYGCIPSKIRK